MGEVRVQVHLTNSVDEGLVRRGQMASAEVRTAQVEALVDTGAVNCVLPPFMADRLGLARPFRQMAEYADGRREEVDVTEPVLIEIEGRKVYEECLVWGDEVLIGQTALEKTDLHVDCRSRKLLPNPAHPYRNRSPAPSYTCRSELARDSFGWRPRWGLCRLPWNSRASSLLQGGFSALSTYNAIQTDPGERLLLISRW